MWVGVIPRHAGGLVYFELVVEGLPGHDHLIGVAIHVRRDEQAMPVNVGIFSKAVGEGNRYHASQLRPNGGSQNTVPVAQQGTCLAWQN